MQPEQYELEKWLWTDSDFEKMGWHDVNIRGMAVVGESMHVRLEKFPPQLEFLLDIDYIFKWVPPRKRGGHFEFWLSPATLAFENVFQLLMDIHSDQPEWEDRQPHTRT